LAEACLARGFGVRAFVRYNGRGDWGWLESSPRKGDMEVVAGDIRDYDAVAAAVRGRDAVFHLAALIGIPYSYVSPLAYVRTNVEGTYNVLQAARENGVGDVLITSTSETYGTAQYTPIDELHPLVGQSPYSASKISADQLAISFHRSFGTPVKIVRPFNCYGPRQSARAVVPTIVTQIQAGRREIRLGSLHPTRDLTFVHDTVAAFLAVHDSDRLRGEVVNVGTGREVSVRDLAGTIARLMKADVELAADPERIRPAESEVERLVCNNAKLVAATGWRPSTGLDEGLAATIGWLSAHAGAYKPLIYNV